MWLIYVYDIKLLKIDGLFVEPICYNSATYYTQFKYVCMRNDVMWYFVMEYLKVFIASFHIK